MEQQLDALVLKKAHFIPISSSFLTLAFTPFYHTIEPTMSRLWVKKDKIGPFPIDSLPIFSFLC